MQHELNRSGSLLGYRAMHHRLVKKYKLRVSREVVRKIILAVDPESVSLRRSHRLIRRNYRSRGPNFCWHIDGNDKLKVYGFSIHGCIDGFSRKMLWLEVATTNKDSSVIAHYYLNAVEIYGLPRIVRGDRGTENSRVAYLQPFLGRDSTPVASFQYGKSVSNQRIERFWCTLRKWFTEWWLEFFHLLTDGGHFDETNPIHVDCIRFAFMEVLQVELDEIKESWNTHLMQSRRGRISGIPDELYNIPDLHAPAGIEFLQLVEIIMEEEDWPMPSNYEEALDLYINLLNEME